MKEEEDGWCVTVRRWRSQVFWMSEVGVAAIELEGLDVRRKGRRGRRRGVVYDKGNK